MVGKKFNKLLHGINRTSPVMSEKGGYSSAGTTVT